MPIIKSAKKRVRVARKATIRNAKTRRSLKSALKTFTKTPSTKALNTAQSQIDKAAKKNVIHKNKAARLKRRAAAAAKAAGVKPSARTKKPAITKPAIKKVATKNPPAKKSPAKNPASKKAAAKK